MKFFDILKIYISEIPKLKKQGTKFTGEEIRQYFEDMAEFNEISEFNNRKFNEKLQINSNKIIKT